MRDGGTGLGLPIVTGLAELHGGRFELRSKVGVGTEASVILPKTRVVPNALQPRKQVENVMPFPVRAA
jgi:two-component system cell cycle sensor histidine kinase PleC